jgi:hypothetical protein
MHKLAQKRGFNFLCYIPSGYTAPHPVIKGLMDSLRLGNRPTGNNNYDLTDNGTVSGTVRDGMQAIIDAFLVRITGLVDAALARVQELEAVFAHSYTAAATENSLRRDETNIDYVELGRYCGLPTGPWLEERPAMNGFMTAYAPFNSAEKNALKVLYNEEDILDTIFTHGGLIPPALVGSQFTAEHARLKAIIDATSSKTQ